ncbi:hypothetical protein [Rhodospira trueperi]|uniref:Calcineurin-like phosphoesterase n=1 Tax=Rhodospira trueperi TaxID=69960 RepID=A0A1G7F0C5_9PROT|nr:hypothetical protein [Rhodospira trueperi]SDE69364.1 hypothetical protein SAMN05421720_11059 [Rhodospira trueperi]
MRPIKTAALALWLGLAVAVPAAAEAPVVGDKAFSFVALGDMPYGDVAQTAYERLIDRVNAIEPAFTIHVGDIKGGGSDCSDDRFQIESDNFMRYTGAVVYTPGDNEWTDCHRESAGGYDPLERLAAVRAKFFPEAESLGQAPIALTRQADVSEYTDMVENAVWQHGGVIFGTVHVIGSNNNFEVRSPEAVAEFFARDAANQAWISHIFETATEADSAAVVIAMQADMFWGDLNSSSGFTRTVETLQAEGEAFAKPVLLVYGDSHQLEIDQPFRGEGGGRIDTMTALQVHGAGDVHAVRVLVDPDLPGVFGYVPVYEPENLRTR